VALAEVSVVAYALQVEVEGISVFFSAYILIRYKSNINFLGV
jgi:hypothetical protein